MKKVSESCDKVDKQGAALNHIPITLFVRYMNARQPSPDLNVKNQRSLHAYRIFSNMTASVCLEIEYPSLLKKTWASWFSLLTISHPASSHRSKTGFGGLHKPAAYPSLLKAGVKDYVRDIPYLSASMELPLKDFQGPYVSRAVEDETDEPYDQLIAGLRLKPGDLKSIRPPSISAKAKRGRKLLA